MLYERSMPLAYARLRSALRVVVVLAPFVLTALACDDSEPAPPVAGVDAGPVGIDSGGGTIPPGDAGKPAVEDAAPDADAAPTTVMPFATGLDASGAVLADQAVDGHWTVKDAEGNAFSAYAQTDALGYPNYWLAPSATSKFISPFIDTVDPTGNGTFTYKTTFSLREGVNLAAVSLVIRCTSDNQMKSVMVNGQALPGVVDGSYSSFQTLTATTGFVVGINTVELVVANSGGPTGMRAELDLTAN